MTITYPKGDNDSSLGLGTPSSTSHLTAIAIAVSIVFIVVAVGLWFGFSQSQKAIEAVPAAVIPLKATVEVEQARVMEAIDGLKRCHDNTPDLSQASMRLKRQNCYYAVMTIFATSAVCDIIALDTASIELCKQAETRFIKDYPNGMPKEDASQAPVNTNVPRNANSTSPGTGQGGTAGSSTGSGTKNTNTGSNANTNSNTSSQNTNVNVNTNTSGAASGNTNTAGNTNSSNTQNNTNTNQTATPSSTEPLCVNDPGEIVLLEHTNNCQ